MNYSNKNLLDNWDFTNPVNQRGQTSYTGVSIYAIDRWKFPDKTGTLIVKDGGIGISFNSSVGYTSIGEYFESLEDLIGKTVTVSILLSDGTIRSVTFKNITANSDISGADFNAGYLNLIMPYKCFRIMITKNSSVTIKAAKLEYGKVSTLKNDLLGVSYAEELRKCQRYYQRLKSKNTHTTISTGTMFSSNDIFFVINLPVPMRTYPTISCSGRIFIQNMTVGEYGIETDIENSNLADDTVSELENGTTLKLHGVTKTAVTRNDNCLVNLGNGSYLELSADL